MKSNTQETLVLVAVKGQRHEPIKEGAAALLNSEASRLKKDSNWKGWDFRIRTKAGYKASPLWKKTKSLKSKK